METRYNPPQDSGYNPSCKVSGGGFPCSGGGVYYNESINSSGQLKWGESEVKVRLKWGWSEVKVRLKWGWSEVKVRVDAEAGEAKL